MSDEQARPASATTIAEASVFSQAVLDRAMQGNPNGPGPFSSYAELARQSGLTDRHLRTIRQGRSPINFTTAARLASACGLTLVQLLYGACLDSQASRKGAAK